jgi:HD-GYP domain-containing protein (c-di-GMP phosphodiesterase class II)
MNDEFDSTQGPSEFVPVPEPPIEALEIEELAGAEDASAAGSAASRSDGASGQTGTARYSQQQLRRARDVLTRLYATRRAVRLYPLDHPAVREGIQELSNDLANYFDEGVDVGLAFFEGEVLLGEQLLTEDSLLFDQLIRDMTALGVGSLVFRRGVAPEEIARAMTLLSADGQQIDRLGGVEAAVRKLELKHIVIGSLQVVERSSRVSANSLEDAQAAYGGSVSLLREIDRLIKSNRHVPVGKVKSTVRSLVDNVLGNRYAMLQLTGLRNYDEYTFYHSANVAILSLALGSTVTNDYRFLSSLGVGALLHDIGKLTVDIDILNKPGALTPEEWNEVRLHPVHGAQMVSVLPGVDKAALVTILEHHMRYDGTGYPGRTPTRRQHLTSRIVAVADSYDAMTSRRSYSAARVQDEAMALLVKSAGSSLDPALVRSFVRLMGVYPPRSVVRLTAGEIGIVLQPSPGDPLRPIVRIIAMPTGEFLEPRDVDLSQTTGVQVRACIDPQLLNIDVDTYL